jgi:hypothetical protein
MILVRLTNRRYARSHVRRIFVSGAEDWMERVPPSRQHRLRDHPGSQRIPFPGPKSSKHCT